MSVTSRYGSAELTHSKNACFSEKNNKKFQHFFPCSIRMHQPNTHIWGARPWYWVFKNWKCANFGFFWAKKSNMSTLGHHFLSIKCFISTHILAIYQSYLLFFIIQGIFYWFIIFMILLQFFTMASNSLTVRYGSAELTQI